MEKAFPNVIVTIIAYFCKLLYEKQILI